MAVLPLHLIPCQFVPQRGGSAGLSNEGHTEGQTGAVVHAILFHSSVTKVMLWTVKQVSLLKTLQESTCPQLSSAPLDTKG